MTKHGVAPKLGAKIVLTVATALTTLIVACEHVTTPRPVSVSARPSLAWRGGLPDSNAFGMHWSPLELFVSGNSGLLDPVLDHIKDTIGATWVRIAISWADVEVGTPGTYSVDDPNSYHRLMVDMAKDKGLNLLVVLTNSSPFHRSGDSAAYAPSSPSAFATYVQRMVDSLPRVDAWAVWNEPDCGAGHLIVPDTMGGEAQQASVYASLVEAAVPIIKAAGKLAVVGEFTLAGTCQGDASSSGTGFAKSVFSKLSQTVLESIDVFSVHAYMVPDDVATFMEHTVYDTLQDPLFNNVQEVWLTEVNAPSCPHLWSDDDPHQGAFVQIVYDTVTSPQRRNARWNRIFWYRDIVEYHEIASTDTDCRFHLIDTTGSGNTLTVREAARRYRWIRDGWPALIEYRTLSNGCSGWCIATDLLPAGVISGVNDTLWEFQIRRTSYGEKLLTTACASVRYAYDNHWSAVACDTTAGNPFGAFNIGKAIRSVKAFVTPRPEVSLAEGLCQAGLTVNGGPGNQWDDPWRCWGLEAGWRNPDFNPASAYPLNAYVARIWPRDITPSCGAWESTGGGPAARGQGGCTPPW